MKRRAITAAEIEAGRTPAGDFTPERLRSWGVRSPPKAGWQRRLLRSGVPIDCPCPAGFVPPPTIDAGVPMNPLLAFSAVAPAEPAPDAAAIFTDGSCRKEAGGWGFAAYRGGTEVHAAFGGALGTTNNRMELAAVIAALRWLAPAEAAVLWTDSQYAVRGVTEWRHGWRKANWSSKTRAPVRNADLWDALFALLAGRPVEVRWVRGHGETAGNRRADGLAETGRRQATTRSSPAIAAAGVP